MLVVWISRLLDSLKQSHAETLLKRKPSTALSATTPVIHRINWANPTMRHNKCNREKGKDDGEHFHAQMWSCVELPHQRPAIRTATAELKAPTSAFSRSIGVGPGDLIGCLFILSTLTTRALTEHQKLTTRQLSTQISKRFYVNLCRRNKSAQEQRPITATNLRQWLGLHNATFCRDRILLRTPISK